MEDEVKIEEVETDDPEFDTEPEEPEYFRERMNYINGKRN